MAQYVSPHPGLEGPGSAFASVTAALRTHGDLGKQVLSTLGVTDLVAGGWYPLQMLLDMLKGVARASGDHTLLAIGKAIVDHAVWPAMPPTIVDALQMIDVAYHMNHRRDGVVMFDPATGVMREGIGHYRCHPEKHEIIMVCDTPYPSELDRGVVLGTARRAASRGVRPRVDVVLDESRPSRKRGADSCAYRVTW
ncbi:hypothetical protein WME79_48065 [Sorangium sp. So ce726]|uniref:hypothetical protein n=1 Tax=Sorangium sp. So ce726 TaxID=3133319 RepID=UPI003F63ED0F